MAGRYLSGSGLGHLWTTMKSTFLLSTEEMSSFSLINQKFATFDDTNPYSCGNTDMIPQPPGRKLIPLQVSPDFNGSTGCLVYESYVLNSQRSHRNMYQVGSDHRLYSVPATGSPTLIQTLSYLSGGSLTNSTGWYVKQDAVYGNWWLSNTNDTIDKDTLGIPESWSGGGDDPIVEPIESASIYITGRSIDSSQLNDSVLSWWNSSDAIVFIRIANDGFTDWSEFTFNDPVTNSGGTRICYPVTDGFYNYQYTLTRTSSSPYININNFKPSQN